MSAAAALRPIPDHDVAPGPLKRCQITGSAELELVIDLGHQPPCDALLDRSQLDQPEATYPLRLMLCPESGLAQLDYVVDGREIYPPSYPYRSGISKPLADYQRAFADGVVDRFALGGALCVDIGSNDGTLLTGFKRNGCQVLGIEPTDVAKIAVGENEVPTLQHFFTEKLAREVVGAFGRARLVTMTNVFAHMAGLGDVMRGIEVLLARDGVFISESHYLLDILEKNQFDTIYHEHIRTYSLKALTTLFAFYGMEVFDVERADRYGGNIRVYVSRVGIRPVQARVGELLQREREAGLFDMATWHAWRDRVHTNRDAFMAFLSDALAVGRSVVGCSSPGRAATLINFYGITPSQIPWLGELENSLKLGKYVPHAHIAIVSNRAIVDEKPDCVVLFAWHYAAAIVKRLRAEGVTAQLVQPLPVFEVLPS